MNRIGFFKTVKYKGQDVKVIGESMSHEEYIIQFASGEEIPVTKEELENENKNG